MRPALLAGLAFAALLAGCAGEEADGPADVRARDVRFDPEDTTWRAGVPLLWRNVGNLAHTVTSQDGGPLDSGTLVPGETYRHTFAAPGVYPYYCVPHANRGADGVWRGMVGNVTVTS